MSDKRLGKGLGAIFGDDISDVLEEIQQGAQENEDSGAKRNIPLKDIRSNPYQARETFDEEKLEELAQSIREHGVFTPILVREAVKGYELVAGERRVKASRMVGLETIPAIIVEFDDEQMMEIGLLENIQRENLNVIEEANAYQQMIDKLGYTHNRLSERVGKSRAHITNLLRLLNLPESVQEMVTEEKLSMSHVRPLITLEDKDLIEYYAEEIIDKGLSVREVESLIREEKNPTASVKPKVKESDPQLESIEDLIESKLQTKVVIDEHNIRISYTNTKDLNRILEILDLLEK